MQAFQMRTAVHVACILGLVIVGGKVAAAPQASSDQATIQQLQKQVDDLTSELDQLKSTDPAVQNQAMQRHWTMMQDHMRLMGQMPGMGGGPRMMGPGMMGPGTMGPGMTGPGMMGQGWWMMGHGMGMEPGMMGWALPGGMTPKAYQQQMSKHMQTMRAQMAAISAEKDPAKRDKLMREHYDAMYRDMQAMRGMGWMWAPNATASLPEPGSRGAQLVSTYCTQCHAAPQTTLHTAKEWAEVTSRMQAHISDEAGTTVKIPTAAELDAISSYLEKHGKTGG
jgi:hypothetical protein